MKCVDFTAKICDTLCSIEIRRKMTDTVATTTKATERLNTFKVSSFSAIKKASGRKFPMSPFELFRHFPLHLYLLKTLENESR